jgi:PAS domain S-box-containing protein
MAGEEYAAAFLFEPPSILLVTVEALDRQDLLGDAGAAWQEARIDVVSDLRALLSLLDRAQPDLILTDARLSDLSAVEVVETVRERGCSAPILVLTRSGEREPAQAALARGAEAFVSRLPADRVQLGNALRGLRRCAEETRLRRRAEAANRFAGRFFEMANRHINRRPMLREFVAEIHAFSGCHAAGIRLFDEQGCLRMEAHEGFPPDFCGYERASGPEMERFWCVQVAAGRVGRGRPCFTSYGSWLVNTLKSGDDSATAEETHGTCSRCRRFGYVSVAMIPIRLRGQALGLLQLADGRAGRVPRELAAVMEKIAEELGGILHRLQVEEALRESEGRYVLAAEAGQVGVWDYRPQTGEFLSGSLKELFGYEDYEVADRLGPWLKVIHPEDREPLEQVGRDCLNGFGHDFKVEHRVLHKDGSIRWVSTSASLHRDREGRPFRMLGTVSDITDRKQADEALRTLRERLTLALDGAQLGMWDWDMPTGQYLINERSADVLGISLKEFDAEVDSWRDRIHPEDREIVDQKLRDHREGRKPIYEAYYRIREASGGWKWILSRGKIVQWARDGQPVRMAGTHLDISERKAAEESLALGSAFNAGLAALSRDMIAAESTEDISALVLREAERLTDSPAGFVGYVDSETGWLIIPTLTPSMWDACQVPGKSVVFKQMSGLWGWVITNGQPLMTNDPAHDPRSTATPPGHVPIARFVAAPAVAGERLMGIVALANAPRDYRPSDIEVAERLAVLYTLALQKRQMETALEQRNLELEHANSALSDALATVKKLGGMLPICSSCKCIRDDAGYWHQVESYIHDHSEAVFSHGLCPDCARRLYPDIFVEP